MRASIKRRASVATILACSGGMSGCVPTSLITQVLSEQLVQSFGLATQLTTGFIFGFADSVLNTILTSFLFTLIP